VKSTASWYVDGFRLYLEAVRLLDEGKPQQAQAVAAVLSQHGEKMAAAQRTAVETGERAEFARGFRTLEVLASELRGRIALAGPKERIGSAHNWFRGAIDRQARAPMLLPPALLTPMESRLGDFQIAAGKPAEAVESYQTALKKFANDPILLQKLAAARKQAGE
jgi:predicted Zn-dependent protease